MMRAVLRLPSEKGNNQLNEQFHQVLQMVIYMVDLVANLKYSPTVSALCEKNRKKQKQLEAKKKQDELEEKLLDQKREQEKLERERILRMTPEQQAKYQEKQRKKEQGRVKQKLMKIVK